MRAMPLPVIKDQLPIVQGEVGDTWNYGTASDPHKLANNERCSAFAAAREADLPGRFLPDD
jgi:hypothetical protein